jgi:hypothetical protein
LGQPATGRSQAIANVMCRTSRMRAGHRQGGGRTEARQRPVAEQQPDGHASKQTLHTTPGAHLATGCCHRRKCIQAAGRRLLGCRILGLLGRLGCGAGTPKATSVAALVGLLLLSVCIRLVHQHDLAGVLRAGLFTTEAVQLLRILLLLLPPLCRDLGGFGLARGLGGGALPGCRLGN